MSHLRLLERAHGRLSARFSENNEDRRLPPSMVSF